MIGSRHRMAAAAERFTPAIMLALAILIMPACAQNTPPGPAGKSSPLGEEVTLDRVVAIVNGDLVLESDVDAEQRFAAFQPFSEAGPASREHVDRSAD